MHNYYVSSYKQNLYIYHFYYFYIKSVTNCLSIDDPFSPNKNGSQGAISNI